MDGRNFHEMNDPLRRRNRGEENTKKLSECHAHSRYGSGLDDEKQCPSIQKSPQRTESFAQIHDHDDAGLDGDAVQRDVANPHGNREVVAEEPLQQHAACHRVNDRDHHHHSFRNRPKHQIQQHENRAEHDRKQQPQTSGGPELECELARPFNRVT